MPQHRAAASRRRFLLASASAAFVIVGAMGPVGARRARADGRGERSLSVRVVLRRPGGSLDAATAMMSSLSTLVVRAGQEPDEIASLGAGERLAVGRDGERFWLEIGGKRKASDLRGPVFVAASDADAPLRVHGDDGEPTASYRGAFEIRQSTGEGRVCLINVVDLDQYVAGVVSLEMPESFGLEAVRAQAVAARGFALARRASSTHADLSADVCDGMDCQAYGGVEAERRLAREAARTTSGLVLTRGEQIVTPLYSSTCGGHTESLSRTSGDMTMLSREGVPDGPIPLGLDLTTDAGASEFFKGSWKSHCAASSRYRWSVEWDRAALEESLTSGLRRLANSPLVTPRVRADDSVGTLEALAVTSRGVSGRALELKISGSRGAWTVQRDWTIRSLLRARSGDPLASSAFALELERSGGKLARVTVFGAGWGHGIGMCQWGARGLAERGKTGEQILAHYFPDTEIRSYLA